ncbi:MAG TPA: sugar phosphate nucleotidyltransferase [Acidobacteriota bacterium]|nr:sugar phosphate nucleotidyltransferase [Acidobacteriota bacterium]
MKQLVGVILAAGRGTRMFPFSERWPKPVLPILGKPLLQHQIEMMISIGIRKIFVVIGYLGYEIVRTLEKGPQLDADIEYVEQIEALGIAHAVGRLEDRVQSPFLLFLGDIYFVSSKLDRLVAEFGKNNTRAVLASKVEDRPEMIRRNFAIIPAEGRVVRRVIEKPRYLENKLKGCGIYLFGLEIFDAIRRTPRTAMRDEYEITEAIQIMIQDGHRVVHANVVEEDWNLTIPEDLLSINLRALKQLGRLNEFVGTRMPGKGLRNCVVGRNVKIRQPVSLRNCVLFDDTQVKPPTKLTNAIITPDGVVQCNF